MSDTDPGGGRPGAEPVPGSDPSHPYAAEDAGGPDGLSGPDDGDYVDEDPYAPEGEEDGGDPHTALPAKMEAWRKRSATGAILTGFALGLQEVFEPKRDEPAIIMETSGEPPKDLPVEADFEYLRPRQSVVNVRPWLLPNAPAETRAEGKSDEAGEDGPGGSGSSGRGREQSPSGDDPGASGS